MGILAVMDSIDDPIPKETKVKFAIESLVLNEKRIGVRVMKVSNQYKVR